MKAAKTPIKSWNSGFGWDSQEALTVIFIEIRINSLPNIQPKRILASFLPRTNPRTLLDQRKWRQDTLCLHLFWQYLTGMFYRSYCSSNMTTCCFLAHFLWQPSDSISFQRQKHKGFWRFCTKNLHSLLQRQCRKQGMLSKSASANLRSAWWMAWRDSLFSSHMVIHRVFGKKHTIHLEQMSISSSFTASKWQ